MRQIAGQWPQSRRLLINGNGREGGMYVAEAQVKTEKAGTYLVQLCKHFAHKVPADYEGTRGRVSFEPGTCHLEVTGDVLHMRCESESEPGVRRIMEVVEVHLLRFAWRESMTMNWTEPAPSIE